MRPWTSLELEALRYLGPRLGGRETAAALDRSHASVKHQAARRGISLRRTDCGTGLALTPEQLVRKIKRYALAPLCPACAKRPASVPTTGLCAPCHHATRVAISEEAIASLEGQRARCAARQKLQRRRREVAALEESALASDGSGDAAATIDPCTSSDVASTRLTPTAGESSPTAPATS